MAEVVGTVDALWRFPVMALLGEFPLPEGSGVRSDDADVDAVLSGELGRPATRSGGLHAVTTLAASWSLSSSMAISRILNFCTLPVTVMGNSVTNFQ